VLSSVWLLSGCGEAPESHFVLNAKTETLVPEARDIVKGVLIENFGTANHLVGWQKFPIDYGTGNPTLGEDNPRSKDGWRLKEGRNLYMQHCLHCHGVSGDGAGPTARFLNPRPRDYRQGIFKFKSTQAPIKPSRADLTRVLKDGIPGTYMPSFVLLGDEKLSLIVDYVRFLSCRGETEIQLVDIFSAVGAADKDVRKRVSEEKIKRSEAVAEIVESINKDLNDSLTESSDFVAEAWTKAELPESVITPAVKRTPPTKDSIDRGRKLYLSQIEGKKTQCADCHGPQGRGDGPNTQQFWPILGTTPERKYEDVGLHDDWGFPQQPRNLTRGVYRFGRRPVDIYRRIYTGIRGTQMPGFGGTVLNDAEIWDVVNYVLSIPFDGKESPWPTSLEEPEKPEVATAEN
jgi:mono/diheme cytochrome c family protein